MTKPPDQAENRRRRGVLSCSGWRRREVLSCVARVRAGPSARTGWTENGPARRGGAGRRRGRRAPASRLILGEKMLEQQSFEQHASEPLFDATGWEAWRQGQLRLMHLAAERLGRAELLEDGAAERLAGPLR